jgi:hypothetical protein
MPLAADFDLIRCNCHNCGKRHRLTPRSAGKPFRCRKCGMKLTAPIPAQDKQAFPPPRRRVWPWAVALGAVIVANAASLRPDARPAPAVAQEPLITDPAPAAIEEIQPEPEPQEPEEVAAIQAPPSAPPVDPPPVIVALPDMSPEDAGKPEISALLQSARAGDAEAMNTIGNGYLYGQVLAQDEAKAVEWYKHAAEAGNAMAMSNLGLCYEEGRGVAQSPEEAAAWYEEAATAGNRDAMYIIATMYERGEGVDQDYRKAAEWYEKSAEAGDAVAMHNIGLCYAVGKGVQADKQLAAQWLTKGYAAGYEDAKPLIGLAMVGIPPVMAATMMANAIGGKYEETHAPPPPNNETQDSPSDGHSMEYKRGMALVNRYLGGGMVAALPSRDTAERQHQRNRIMLGTSMRQANANVQRSIRGR